LQGIITDALRINDPTAHAEILVLRKSGEALRNYRLNDTMIYVTAEPCPMCASAIVHGRVFRLIFEHGNPSLELLSRNFDFWMTAASTTEWRLREES